MSELLALSAGLPGQQRPAAALRDARGARGARGGRAPARGCGASTELLPGPWRAPGTGALRDSRAGPAPARQSRRGLAEQLLSGGLQLLHSACGAAVIDLGKGNYCVYSVLLLRHASSLMCLGLGIYVSSCTFHQTGWLF